MHALRAANDEPFPGYRLLAPLGKGGFGEVWKCQAPGGLCKAIKFVQGGHNLHDSTNGAEQERRSIDNIKGLRHPFLLSIERVEVVGSDLVIVTELADRSLHDLLTEHKSQHQPGIPRPEVLAYLREAAEVLDVLNQEHGLQHLDVKPRNLFLVGKHVKVADFGLVASIAELYGREDLLNNVTPLYAAPEIFSGHATLFSDQYSLAVTYHELITGTTPFQARNVAQMAYLAATTPPDLSRLTSRDQPLVAKALSKNPRERYPSCTAFLDALQATAPTSGVVKATSTSFEFHLGDMTATAVVPTVSANNSRGSGVYRRATRVVPAGQTPASAPAEPLAGYQLLECLGRGQTGELWRARSPNQEPRLIRFLTPPDEVKGESPLDRLKHLRHPTLPRLEVVPVGPERVALVCDAGDDCLANVLKDCRARGQPGIPRAELLSHLGTVAQALDEIYHTEQIQHLTLSPRHVALSREQPLLLEFGLAELLWLPQGLHPATLSPRYASLEMFDGLVSDSCDQFSLALMFQELLVGVHPYRNLNARQMASPKLRGQPDLSMLPGPDRPVILQALDAEPGKRFRSCVELIHALEDVTYQAEHGVVSRAVSPSPLMPPTPPPVPPPDHAQEALDELVQAVSRGYQVVSTDLLHYLIAPGTFLEHRGWARLAPGMARLKMAGFREQWQAEVIDETPSRRRFIIKTATSLFDRCLGRLPALQLEIVLGTPRDNAANLTPVRVTIQPMDCGRGKAEQLLADVGPNVLASLHKYLSQHSERAEQERYPLTQAVYVNAPAAGQSVSAQVRDVGRLGMTVLSPIALPTGAVTVTLNRWASPVTVQVNGWVRDCLKDEETHEIEIAFHG